MTVQDRPATASEQSLDARMVEFLTLKINSFVKWDLIRFFHDNPHAVESAENIARYAGRELGEVEPELLEMSEAHLLEVQDVNQCKIFRLVRDPQTRALIRQFVEACDDREFRVQAIQYVIKRMI